MNKTTQNLIDLTRLSKEDLLLLENSADRTQLWADDFVKMFYNTLFSYSQTKDLFRDGERLNREMTIKTWYLQVVKGEVDDHFWDTQLQAGQRHIERNIHNSYMQGMMHQTQQFFLDKCMATFEREKGLEIFNAFNRVTDVNRSWQSWLQL